MCGIAQSSNNGGQGEEYEDERLQRHVLHASRSARARHAGAFADTAQRCSRSDSALSPAVSQGHSTSSPASTIPFLPCSAMPGLTLLPPSRAAMRASARSRPRPYPALASVVCVLMLPCVCPFLVRLSLLASLVACLCFLLRSEIYRRRVQRRRLAVPAPAQPARPPRLRFMWCALRSFCARHGVVSDTIGSGVGCQSVVLLSVAVALSATHPITPHHILHTAHTSRKPHTPLAPSRHSYYTPCTSHTLHLPHTYHTWHNPSHPSHLSHTPHPHYTTSTHHTHSSPNTSHHPSLILAHMQV